MSVRRGVSLRLRMVGLSAVAMTLVVGATGLALGIALGQILEQDAVRSVEIRADAIVELAKAGALPRSVTPERITIEVDDDDADLVQVVDARDHVLLASSGLEDEPALPLARMQPGNRSVYRVPQLPVKDDVFTVVAVGANTPQGPVTVYAATSIEEITETVMSAYRVGLTGLPLLVLAWSLVMWVIVGRTLAPVEAIRRQVDAISERELDRRVPEPPYADEIGRLARTMNRMLTRLEASSRRQRQFVADAAHELRSPVASLRVQLETARASTRPVAWDGLSADLLTDVIRMQELADQLLLLARADAGTLGLRPATVDLDDLVLRVVAARIWDGVTVDRDGVEPVQIRGDAALLERVVDNLLANARRHARGRVEVALAADGRDARLTVSDDGEGIPEADRARVFERFMRLDDARDRDHGGAGLGLAIARDIVAAHDGTISVTAAPGGGARFEVRVPIGRPRNGAGLGRTTE